MNTFNEAPRIIVQKLNKIIKTISTKSNLENYKDWKWQVKHTIKDIESFENLSGIKFDDKERIELQKTVDKFPISITPYYLSLIQVNNYKNDPIFRQAFPDSKELNISKADMLDPLAEDSDSPVKGITHRYPDRVLFHISNMCAMYCRHCTRKRKVGDIDYIPDKKDVLQGIEYIKNNPVIRDVLLSGGDPFMLSDDYIDWILSELKKIPHIEVIRIGTRTPVVLPFRITDKLVSILKKHQPIWINTHFNHPREITSDSIEAINKLADAGIPIGNQSVLLAGINDCTYIMKKLVRKLVQNRVRPYYLYQCDLTMGLSHFRTPVGKGIEIIEGLIGHTSGFSIPTYVIDAPGGGGKIPVMPNYLVSWSTNKVILRNFEGIITTYNEPENYEDNNCELDCNNCNLYLKMEAPEESAPVGIKKLFCNVDNTISLIPNDIERMERRKDE
ncbi:MAG: lysine 2,3-aminomutase [Candidatus Gastranaerophilales bacterium]|nr:lysine 2,3-aminomutase [Candidatus Gastranaerophilales bacterium]